MYIHAQEGWGGGFRPPPQAGEKMYRVGGEERKKKEKGKNGQINRKNQAKNRKKRGKIEENQQIWLKIGTYR